MAAVAARPRHLLVAAPLATAACLAGHALGYRLAGAGVADVALHGYLRYAPLVLASAGSLLALALGLRVAGRLPGRPAAWPYALVPPIAYAAQELAERLAAGIGPAGLLHAPVLAGLAVQAPLAALAYVLARALLRCADAAASLLAGEPPAASATVFLPAPAPAPLPRRRPHGRPGLGRAPPR